MSEDTIEFKNMSSVKALKNETGSYTLYCHRPFTFWTGLADITVPVGFGGTIDIKTIEQSIHDIFWIDKHTTVFNSRLRYSHIWSSFSNIKNANVSYTVLNFNCVGVSLDRIKSFKSIIDISSNIFVGHSVTLDAFSTIFCNYKEERLLDLYTSKIKNAICVDIIDKTDKNKPLVVGAMIDHVPYSDDRLSEINRNDV